jgi:hypothetical protein
MWTPLQPAILFLHYAQTGSQFDYVRLNSPYSLPHMSKETIHTLSFSLRFAPE